MSKSNSFMPEPGSFARRRGNTVLLVDDYADAREQLRDLLEEKGYPVIEAANGQEAIDVLVSSGTPSIGLIVLDLSMPVMDGRQFLRLLGSYTRLAEIPVVVVSGHTAELGELERQRLVGCLQQPYRADELLGVVSSWVKPFPAQAQ
jgi:CheY-like chemotaxis protein